MDQLRRFWNGLSANVRDMAVYLGIVVGAVLLLALMPQSPWIEIPVLLGAVVAIWQAIKWRDRVNGVR